MITKKDVESLPPNSIVWDGGRGSVAGFGARRQASTAVNFFLRYRNQEGRSRCPTIGRFGAPWTVDDARKEALRMLGRVANGEDPAADKAAARQAQTVAELCDAYIAEAEAGNILVRGKAKKASTTATDKGRVERHIKPLLGRMKVAAVTSADVLAFRNAVAKGDTAGEFKTGPRGLARVKGGKGTATRTLALLSTVFSYAIQQRMRADNPCRGVAAYAYQKRKRRLALEEYIALGRALDDVPTVWPPALAAIWFIAITGWRRGEVLNLSWAEIDLRNRTAHLQDTKTGESMRPLSAQAVAILQAQPKAGDLVFPSPTDPGKPIGNFHKLWLKLRKRAALQLALDSVAG
jgi:integrase